MKFKLRDYQKAALNQIHADLKTQKNVLLSAMMGAGKTVITARLINKYWKTSDKQFLILAHKQELCQQFYSTFKRMTDLPENKIGICCAGLKRKDTTQRLTIGSIQTFVNLLNGYFKCDFLVIDEVHKIFIGKNSQYDQVIDHLRTANPEMRILGLTASPYRMGSGFIYGDKCTPGTINLFSKINHKITYNELKESGYLVPLKGKVVLNESLESDLNRIDKNGDYVLDQLGEMMSKSIHISTVVQAIQKYTQGYKRLCIFACTIDHAEKINKAVNQKFPEQGTIVHSKLSSIERYSNMEAWKTGQKRIMVSINILVEGFDFPALDCLIIARPTESTGLFLQAIGRVLRISEGKEKALLIDLTTNTQKFGTDLDNMKVIVPKAASVIGKQKHEKQCPACDERLHITIRMCPNCGYEWTVEANEKIIAKQMPELKNVLFEQKKEIIVTDPPAWYDVLELIAFVHKSKKSDAMLGRLDMYYGDVFTYISVYFCFPDFYQGYAVEKAFTLWPQFSDAPFPLTVQEFDIVAKENGIKMPNRILLNQNDKWPKLIEVEQQQQQEYSDKIPF